MIKNKTGAYLKTFNEILTSKSSCIVTKSYQYVVRNFCKKYPINVVPAEIRNSSGIANPYVKARNTEFSIIANYFSK